MTKPVSCKPHRFSSQIIAHAVWFYFRFTLSLGLVEEMLLERGIVVSYEMNPPVGKEVRSRVCPSPPSQAATPE
jgi:transposase-like protein